MKSNEFTAMGRLRSFRYAWEGVVAFFRAEHNAWLHLAATAAVFGLAGYLRLDKSDWLALLISIGLVWMAELFNSAIEKLMDFVSVHRRPEIKFIKDISASAVLVAAITAAIVGGIVFIPKIL